MHPCCRLFFVSVLIRALGGSSGDTLSVTQGSLTNPATTLIASPISLKAYDSRGINPATTSVTIAASPVNSNSCDSCDNNPATALMASPMNSNSCDSCDQCNVPVYALGATTGIFAVTTAILLVILLIVLCKRRSYRVERKRNVFEEGTESRYWEDPLTLPSISLETTLSEQKEPNVWFSLDTADTFKDGAEDASSRDDKHHSQHQLRQKTKRWHKPKRKAPLPPNVTRFKSKSGEVVYAVPNARGTLSFYANSHQYKELDPEKMKKPSEYTKPARMQPHQQGPSVAPKPCATEHKQQ